MAEVTAQVESFIARLEELKPLLPSHYEELALDKEAVPLDPNYPVYFEAEKLGRLLFITLRERGALIGYFIGFIAPGLHYRTCLTCNTDIFYVHPDHRKRFGGLMLLKRAREELERRGVNRWFIGTKMHADCGPLFERMGFRHIENYYSQMLGAGKWSQRQ